LTLAARYKWCGVRFDLPVGGGAARRWGGASVVPWMLLNGTVSANVGRLCARIWVDANQPVVHLEVQSASPVQMEAKSELWRTKTYHLNQHAVSQAGFFEFGNNPNGLTFDPDTIFPTQNNEVSWCHFNSNSIYPLIFEHEHLESLLPKYPDPLLYLKGRA